MTQNGSDARLFHQLHLKNLLSYGPESEPLALGALNVLIGPNGSGKSNLLEAIALLRAAPGDMRAVVRKGGGVLRMDLERGQTGCCYARCCGA
jgi:predicted ATPase